METTNKKSGYTPLFWTLGAAAVVGLVGSAYYVFNLFQAEEEIPEQQLENIVKVQEKMDNNMKTGKQELDIETAVQIMAITNKLSEETLKKHNPDLEKRRREAINQGERYDELCMEYIEAKEREYQKAMQIVFANFPGVTMEDIQRVMQNSDPQEVERLNSQFDPAEFEAEKPSREATKKAYIYYGQAFTNNMKEMVSIIRQTGQSGQGDPQQEQFFFIKMLITKMKIDDIIFIEHKLTESQMKSLLMTYNLMEDPEIVNVNRQLMTLQQMFGLPMEN